LEDVLPDIARVLVVKSFKKHILCRKEEKRVIEKFDVQLIKSYTREESDERKRENKADKKI